MTSASRDPLAPDPPVDERRMLEKVRALLAKAESTEFDEEAEVFTAKAQELMARYAIDEAMIEAAAGGFAGGWGSGPTVDEMLVTIADPYASPKALLLHAIALENRCRSVYHQGRGTAGVIGSATDRQAVDVLYTSLLVQAVAAMRRAGSHTDADGTSRTRSFRTAFLTSFAMRIGERLAEATQRATAAAVEEVGAGFLPVLARRSDEVDRVLRERYPRRVSARRTVSNAAGWHAGRAAADEARLDPATPIDRRSA